MAGDIIAHPTPLDSPSDRGGLLIVLSWVFIIVAILILATRMGKRWAISKSFKVDDALITIATVIAILQTICLLFATRVGYGRLGSETNLGNYQSQQKLIYVFNLLFFFSQAFSMGSVVILIRSLTPIIWHNNACNLLLYSMGVWAFITALGLIFQCRPPRMWLSDNNTCIHRVAFYTFVEVLNLVFEVSLIALPMIITWNLQVKVRRKIIVIVGFSGRIFVIAALIAQLAILYRNTDNTFPFYSWKFALTSSLAQSLSIIAACVPYLRPFLEGIDRDTIANDGLFLRRFSLSTGDIPAQPNLASTLDDQSILKAPFTAESTFGLQLHNRVHGSDVVISSEPTGSNNDGSLPMSSQDNHIRETRTITVQSFKKDSSGVV